MRCNIQAFLTSALIAASGLLTGATTVFALPFNTDMMDRQPVTGSIMRPKAPNSVAYGSLEDRVETRDDAIKLVSPNKADPLSVQSGERLFAVNCSPCHGRWTEGKHHPGSLPAMMPSVDLTQQKYRDMNDGTIYGAIHFGSLSTLMPAYGWKLSPTEHWDIVNYLRKVQSEIGK